MMPIPPVAIDYAAIAGSVLRPRREGLAAASLLIQGIESAEQAWEALVAGGILAATWRDDARRRFGAEEPLCHPARVDEALLFASDPMGIERAEAHARELVRRLQPWGAPPVEVVRWRVGDFAYSRRLGHSRRCKRLPWYNCHLLAYAALGYQSPTAEVVAAHLRIESAFQMLTFGNAGWMSAGGTAASGLQFELKYEAAHAIWWAHAAARDLLIPASSGFGDQPALRGQRFAALPNPLDSVAALWETGYGFDALFDGSILLVAPPLSG